MGVLSSFAGLPLRPQVLGIHFNSNLGLQSFSEPYPFPGFLPVFSGPGVYVILASSAIWTPRQYRPIYFGETEDFSKRVGTAHEHYSDWQRAAGSARLYVAHHWMFEAKDQRLRVERALIDWYQPPVNGSASLASVLTQMMLNKQNCPLPTTFASILSGLNLPKVESPPTPKWITPRKPAPVRAFIGFDYDHDADLRMLLVGQSKHPDTPFEIHDWSVKEPFRTDWKERVREKIRRVDQVIFICGEHTDTAAGVAAEVEIAQQENKTYFLLWGRKDKICKKPKTARPEDQIYKWGWENLKNLIHGGR
jgi:hypothetical protein